MRNPFKRVYCEDCENMMPDTNFPDPGEKLEFAKCKADPRNNKKHISRITKVTDYYCCSSRLFPFCFKFVAKGDEEQDNG